MDGEFPAEIKGIHHSVTNILHPGFICHLALSQKRQRKEIKNKHLRHRYRFLFPNIFPWDSLASPEYLLSKASFYKPTLFPNHALQLLQVTFSMTHSPHPFGLREKTKSCVSFWSAPCSSVFPPIPAVVFTIDVLASAGKHKRRVD